MHPNDPTNSQPKFTFTSQLTQATKWIEQKDKIQEDIQHKPVIHDQNLPGNLKTVNNSLAKCFQSRDFLIYALIQWEGKLTSNLHMYYFGKAKGDHQCRKIPGLKGRIVSFEFSYPFEIKYPNDTSQFQTKLVMGNQDGFIKIVDFAQRSEIRSFQIDTKAIVDIQVPPPESFSKHHVCFALLEDYNVYIVSIQHGTVFAHFRPTIMMCDVGLSLSLHCSMKYFMETTQGGYIVLWKINQNLLKKLQQVSPDSNEIKKIYNVFPTSILHSASIEGIIWASFFGDFIAIITSKGIFKIIAINIQEKQQFAILLSYQITNGQTIKSVKLLPRQQCLIVVRQQNYSSVVECIFFSPLLEITKILRLRPERMPIIDGILLSSNFKYVFLRNSNCFYISFTKLVEDSLLENRRSNDDQRQITY